MKNMLNKPNSVFNKNKDLPRTISKRNGAGFTLLEMMVSVSIFTIVMTISTGAILTLNDSLQKAKTMRAAVENVSFVLEGMAKKIRTGTSFVCLAAATTDYNFDMNVPKDCLAPTGGKKISFWYSEQRRYVSYQFNPTTNAIEILTTAQDVTDPLTLKQATPTLDTITGADITITSMTFYLKGACPYNYNSNPNCAVGNDYDQPKIIITITGKANLPGKIRFDTTFNIETTVSSRVLDAG